MPINIPALVEELRDYGCCHAASKTVADNVIRIFRQTYAGAGFRCTPDLEGGFYVQIIA
jgi:hypothetical protein